MKKIKNITLTRNGQTEPLEREVSTMHADGLTVGQEVMLRIKGESCYGKPSEYRKYVVADIKKSDRFDGKCSDVTFTRVGAAAPAPVVPEVTAATPGVLLQPDLPAGGRALDDAKVAAALRAQWAVAQRVQLHAVAAALKFGAMLAVAEGIVGDGRGRGKKGEGFKGWLEKNCPEINYDTARRWRNRSANDGAVVLAEHSSLGQRASRPLPAAPESDPTEESKRLVRAFVDRMNRRAQELGMTNTRYVSPNGMTPYRNQAYPGFDTSTATDLSKLARHLVTMPEVFKYTSCPERAIAMGDRKDVSLVAHNYFLPGTTDPQKYATPVPGCDGLKTGFTDAAGASIVLTAQRDGRRVVAVVLGCANRLTRETAAACILRTALDAR